LLTRGFKIYKPTFSPTTSCWITAARDNDPGVYHAVVGCVENGSGGGGADTRAPTCRAIAEAVQVIPRTYSSVLPQPRYVYAHAYYHHSAYFRLPSRSGVTRGPAADPVMTRGPSRGRPAEGPHPGAAETVRPRGSADCAGSFSTWLTPPRACRVAVARYTKYLGTVSGGLWMTPRITWIIGKLSWFPASRSRNIRRDFLVAVFTSFFP
jgi:hypothetical protein